MAAVPILTFHDLSDDDAVVAFPPTAFAAMMQRLRRKGWRTMALAELAESLAKGDPLPPQRFVITFDDGYRSVHEHAAPVLDALGFDANLFLAVGPPDAVEPPSIDGRPLLSWQQVRDLSDRGWTIDAHGRDHMDLTQRTDAEIEADVAGSIETIASKLGPRPAGFSYPFGRMDARVRSIVEGHVAYAVSDRLGLVDITSDCHALPRVEMYYFRRRPWSHTIGTPLFAPVLAARAGPRRLRRLL